MKVTNMGLTKENTDQSFFAVYHNLNSTFFVVHA